MCSSSSTTFSVSPRLTLRCPPCSVAFHLLSVTSQLSPPILVVSRSALPPPRRVPLPLCRLSMCQLTILPILQPPSLTWTPPLCSPVLLPSWVSTHASILST